MIRFLTKGILRDRSRSLFPILVVTLTVGMIVFFKGFMTGAVSGFFRDTAVVSTGHVKIMTRAYEEEHQLLPNSRVLALLLKHFSKLHQQMKQVLFQFHL